MRFLIITFVIFSCGLCMAEEIAGSAQVKLPPFKGMCGVNLPYYEYGSDVGVLPGQRHIGWSARTDMPGMFGLMARDKVNVLRIHVFADCRAGLLIDGRSAPLRITDLAWKDIRALLSAAEDNGVKLIPIIFDSGLADGNTTCRGRLSGEHPDWITDPAKRKAVLNVVSELVTGCRESTAVLAWEAMANPEYCRLMKRINQPAFTCQDQAKVFDFLTEMIDRIHRDDPGRPVTVGVSNLMENCDWANLPVDFYSVGFLKELEMYTNYDAPLYGFKKPILVNQLVGGEVALQMTNIRRHGWAGLLFWSIRNTELASYTFDSYNDKYREWMENN